jgi:2-amino-4-hydroxy-6-hydroxymethyldihydropteridine diphosphokinase
MTKARIYIGVGSNIDPEDNISSGITSLNENFGKLTLSSTYATEPIGFTGDEFYNLVVGCDTVESLDATVKVLKRIEADHGRRHDEEKYSSRMLDLDLLTYDDLVLRNEQVSIPRVDISKYAFVLKPLAEIAPSTCHPETGLTYQEMWNTFPDATGIRRDVSDLFMDAYQRNLALNAVQAVS